VSMETCEEWGQTFSPSLRTEMDAIKCHTVPEVHNNLCCRAPGDEAVVLCTGISCDLHHTVATKAQRGRCKRERCESWLACHAFWEGAKNVFATAAGHWHFSRGTVADVDGVDQTISNVRGGRVRNEDVAASVFHMPSSAVCVASFEGNVEPSCKGASAVRVEKW